MPKIDLHTHSIASRDGGIKPKQYRKALQKGLLDCVAVTDHNTIVAAKLLRKELGKAIIVGEEISSLEGDIIGLFLKEKVEAGQSAIETVKAIKEQGGLVYIPHPFETIRKGLTSVALQKIKDYVDIVEVYNGRAWAQNRAREAATWATLNEKAHAASSDAHGSRGLGHSYTFIDSAPAPDNLVAALHSHAKLVTKRAPVHTLLYPKINRLKKVVRRQSGD